jgi:hypothetical protein
MKKQMVLTTIVALIVLALVSPAGVNAGSPMAIFVKIGDLMAGAGTDRGYPDHVVVTNVLISGTRVETCAATQGLDDDPIGMISARIGQTKGYLDKASAGLREQAKSGKVIPSATLSIDEGGKRCAVAFGKLSDLTVTHRGDFDEITMSFEEIKVTLR